MKWIRVEDELPKDGETVWITDVNSKFVSLGALVYSDGWMWSVSNGNVYSEKNKIISECILDDEYNITHWMYLPKLPKK